MFVISLSSSHLREGRIIVHISERLLGAGTRVGLFHPHVGFGVEELFYGSVFQVSGETEAQRNSITFPKPQS